MVLHVHSNLGSELQCFTGVLLRGQHTHTECSYHMFRTKAAVGDHMIQYGRVPPEVLQIAYVFYFELSVVVCSATFYSHSFPQIPIFVGSQLTV